MRLREVHQVLQANFKLLETSVRDMGGNNSEVQNRQSLLRALSAIAEIPFFARDVSAIVDNVLFQRESAVVPTPVASGVADEVANLQVSCGIVLDFLNSVLPQQPEHYFAVKLPTGVRTTDESVKLLQRLSHALDQPIRRLGYPPLKITMFDVGSSWTEFAAAAIPALTVVGALVSLAVTRATRVQERAKAQQELERVRQERARVEQEEAKVRQEDAKALQEEARAEQERLKLEVARLEFALKMAEKREQMAQLEFEMRVASFVHGTSEPAENAAFLENAVNELVSLHEDGAEFRLQLDAPPEVRNAFPPEALPHQPDGPRKLLPEKRK